MSKNRFSVFPSRCNFVLFKQKIQQASRGFTLLRGKKDSLEVRLRAISAENKELRTKFDNLLRAALFTLAQAKFVGWDNRAICIQNPDLASFFITVTPNSVAGVNVPGYNINESTTQNFPLTGLGSGGQHVNQVREAFLLALELIVKMAFLQSAEDSLKEASYKCNIRLNGLEFVMIPKLQKTMTYISTELDEIDREETYRLKKSLQATIKRAKTKEMERLNAEMANMIDEKPSSIASLQEFYECLENNRAECDKLCSVFRSGGSVNEYFSALDYFDPKTFGSGSAMEFYPAEDNWNHAFKVIEQGQLLSSVYIDR